MDRPAKAKDLYISDLFTKNMAYAQKLNPDAIYVLSAKYGLLALDDDIAPYEMTLNTMPASARRAWSDAVLAKLSTVASLSSDEFIFLAGERYREYLIPAMKHYQVPFEGLSFGNQLKALKQALGSRR